MIPTEGLIGSFRGQMLMVLIWFVVGFIACTALTVALMVRKAPPLTTQTDYVTGVKDHGIGRWWLGFASFTIAPPLLFGVVRTLIEAVNRLNAAMPYWWIVAGLFGVCVTCVVVYRRFGKRLDRTYEPELPDPPPASRVSRVEFFDGDGPEQPERVGWSLPPEMPQWDGR